MTTSHSNRLAKEASLYLQQHATNPVDWYPWGEEALAKAKKEDKPILLSIGYSACHWCHVMAQESFADDETAKVMNELFINIKVDREERPDLDKIYQMAHQLLTGRPGGWPLTVFLTPGDQIPYYAGTYFPRLPRYGMPGFTDLLYKITSFYYSHRHRIEQQNKKMLEALRQLATPSAVSSDKLNSEPLFEAKKQLAEQFDRTHGGFGEAPKFPCPTFLEYLFHQWEHALQQGKEDKATLMMLEVTLIKMAQGGIYDQLGGGFFRYSVDTRWQIPHFEKMLYDNAQLLACYAKADVALKNPLFQHVIAQTVDWLQREMRAPQGGYFATLDADSEHVEGKFYYWDKAEITSLLTQAEYDVANLYFGLEGPPNFEGFWHLHIARDLPDVAQQLHLDQQKAAHYLQSAITKLHEAREKRTAPSRDEKILTAWNALVIKGLALASLALKKDELIDTAQQTLDFIRHHLFMDGTLFACYKNGHVYQRGYLDDYAFLLEAIVVLLHVRSREQDVKFATDLADILLTHFYDHQSGGFFFTSDQHERLIQRPKPLIDEALPSGNGVAALALLRLGRLINEPRYIDAAQKTLQVAWLGITSYPASYCSLLNALQELTF